MKERTEGLERKWRGKTSSEKDNATEYSTAGFLRWRAQQRVAFSI